jgi:sugar phosphate isomerase/epimerase
MSLETGFVAVSFFDFQNAITHAVDCDLDFVELVLVGDEHRERLDPITDDVRAHASEHGVDLNVHLPFSVDIGSAHGPVRKGAIRELEANIDTTAALGADKAVVHASSYAMDFAWEKATIQEHVLDAIQTLDAQARDLGVELCVENVADHWFPLDDFSRLFEETDASMTLDTGHANLEGYDSAAQAEFVREHADRISHVHCNDVRKQRDEHLPFGAGKLDFEQILAPLGDATLSLEVVTPSFDYVETSAEQLHDVIDEMQ